VKKQGFLMITDEQTERWKKLQRLRWSIILLFFVLFYLQ